MALDRLALAQQRNEQKEETMEMRKMIDDVFASAEALRLADTPPTRQCFVCDKKENEEALFINGAAWLCPECKRKIKQIIEREDK